MTFAEIVNQEFGEYGLDIPQSARERLVLYANEIEHWNRAVNLTALGGAGLVRRLIVEPVWVGRHLDMNGVLADVGSGNGSPGIPLCLTRGISSAYLIEPRMKRAAFLRHVVSRLGLKHVAVLRNRIEEIPAGSFGADWIVLQAIDPTGLVLASLRRIAFATTHVVWITSLDSPPTESSVKLEIPGSATKVWIFKLDQI